MFCSHACHPHVREVFRDACASNVQMQCDLMLYSQSCPSLYDSHIMLRCGDLWAASRSASQHWRVYSVPAQDRVRAAFSHCLSQLQTYEYEDYVWTIQLPKVCRGCLFDVLHRAPPLMAGGFPWPTELQCIRSPTPHRDQALRPAIVALRAFFIETELVAEHAKSQSLVTMRCQVSVARIQVDTRCAASRGVGCCWAPGWSRMI